MLFSFLLGLGFGSELTRRLLSRGFKADNLVFAGILCLAFAVLAGVLGLDSLPDYFSEFVNYYSAQQFSQREFIRWVVCLVVMLPPAACIGFIYPACMQLVGEGFSGRQSLGLGIAAGMNTVGNVLGVIICGFVLLPWLGAKDVASTLVALVIVIGITFALVQGSRITIPRSLQSTGVFFVLLLWISQPDEFDYTKLSSGANIYFQKQGYGHVIDHAESLDGGLTTVAVSSAREESSVKTLLSNGKFQGNNSGGMEMKFQSGAALLPLLYTGKRDDALVIGYGTGVSARVVHDAGFAQIDIVELSREQVDLADRHFRDENKRVTRQRNVNTH
jgi:predicted membrane-bound spermidine synthase